MNNDPTYWREALRRQKAGEPPQPVTDTPEVGYYRWRLSNGDWVGICFWQAKDDDTVFGRRGVRGEEVQIQDVTKAWSYSAKNPVSKAAYMSYYEGKGWPDGDATVAAQVADGHAGKAAARTREDAITAGKLGDNSAEDPAVILADQIQSALAGLAAYDKGVDSEDAAAGALSLRNRLNELGNEADKLRDKLVRPLNEQVNAINDKWMPMVKNAKAAGSALMKMIDDHETRVLAAIREAQRAEAERIERDAAREAAAAEAGEPAPEFEPEPAAPAPQMKAQVKPSYGKAASKKVVMVVTEIIDLDALFKFMRNRDALHICLKDLAQKDIDAGNNVPGIKIEERVKTK